MNSSIKVERIELTSTLLIQLDRDLSTDTVFNPEKFIINHA